ncbi:MAG: hypothetical protein ACI9ST_000324 [Psychrobacter glaciei]|jgi:hypothetical protein
MNKITANASKMYAKFADSPATPPNPRKLAISAITAKIIAQRNIDFSSIIIKNQMLRHI